MSYYVSSTNKPIFKQCRTLSSRQIAIVLLASHRLDLVFNISSRKPNKNTALCFCHDLYTILKVLPKQSMPWPLLCWVFLGIFAALKDAVGILGF